ncbi:Ubiquinone/menaquinone biosynthesis C-methyltransferase UbiE [bacterium HR17]|uniref:Ubiquinone/menaquinone biosynthesis C-methyltransferase UbiE n=1 Tax=Candidatus Fervidibacter japonicus TaxID=2035412 RepID=A0A2H5XAH6_9BACT|nr:Ubiquinone/menaquinone biosynthesis C-methyltransferase UbiE [bacterium HR17]
MASVSGRHDLFAHGYHWVADESEAAEQIEFARRLLYLPVGASVLMPFCGAGWHAHELAMWGYQVVGVDPCLDLVRVARAHNEKAGVTAYFSVSPITTLPFDDATFDAAMILGNRFGLTGNEREDAQLLAELSRILKPEGRLVAELPHRDGIVRHWQERDWERLTDDAICFITREWDALTGRVLEEWTVHRPDQSPWQFAFTYRVYTPTEFASLLSANGFQLTNAFGTFLGADLRLHHPRMLIQAVRQR